MDKYNYTGNKMKNYFTAYLQESIRGKRYNYLERRNDICDTETSLEENEQIYSGMTVEEFLEKSYREELLLKEGQGIYPTWSELSDQRLINALMLLGEKERRIIYQRVFEERTFKEMGYLNNLSYGQVKGIYYYAIRKIRRWMGGER